MGKRLKFYVGYELDGKLTPLSILKSDLSLIEDTLTEVIKYTSSFNNESQLREAINNGPIANNIPKDAKLVYLVETDSEKKTYKKVLDLDYICYSEDKNYLDPEPQVEYIFDYKYDIDFIEKLYALVIRCSVNMEYLNSLYAPTEKNDTSNRKLIEVFKRNRKILHNGDSFLLSCMDQVYSEVIYANSLGIDNYLLDNDRKDIDHILERFYASFTIKKDKQRNYRYDPNSGRFLRDPRIMGYLAITIAKDTKDRYEKYLRQIEDEYQDRIFEEEYEPDHSSDKYTGDLYYTGPEGHDEEFLTEEDFRAKNLDPESNGYAFRKSGL